MATPRGDPYPPITAHIYLRNRIVGDKFIPGTPWDEDILLVISDITTKVELSTVN